MQIICPACQIELTVPNTPTKNRIRCPGCGSAVSVPEPVPSEEPDAVETDGVWIDGEREPQSASAAPATKICPMCGETVLKVARKCRYCGEALAGIQGSDGSSLQGVWRDGQVLVMSKDARLPAICVQTNRPTNERLRRRLYWHSPWYYLLIVISLLIYAIVALAVRQSADIQIGLSRERIVRRRWIILGAWLGSFLGIGLCVAGATAANQQQVDGAVAALWISGLALFLGSMIVGVILSRVITPQKITARHVWIKGVHPEYLSALPTFPGE